MSGLVLFASYINVPMSLKYGCSGHPNTSSPS
jgi:hypothetical protein